MPRSKPDHVLLRTGQKDPPLTKRERTERKRIVPKKRRKGMGLGAATGTGITDEKWKKLLELAANGITRKNIFKRLKITRQTFEAYMVTHVNALKQLREADGIWLRRAWPTHELEEMFDLMCTGVTVKSAGAQMGWDERKLANFYRIVRTNRTIREWYDNAREIQAESWLDDNVDISDNRGNDTYIDKHGNRKRDHGVVQRDKLRIDTRQWTMGAVNRKRFGEHKHVDHSGDININHAAVLGKARRRLEKIRQPATVDNETQQVVGE